MRMNPQPAKLLLLCLIPVVAAGCPKPGPICPPLCSVVPMEQVAGEYNANAARIERLWARANVEFLLRKKPSDLAVKWGSADASASPNALLILNKSPDHAGPADFLLLIKEAAQPVAQIGISRREGVYYMWLGVGENRLCRWGRLEYAGAPGIKNMPIDPTQLLSVLSVCELPAGRDGAAFITQRVSLDPCAYVLAYMDTPPTGRGVLLRREVYFRWDAKKLRRAFMVKIYDQRGRPVMKAAMKDYKAIATPGETAPAPIMPTDIRLRWEKTGTEMRMVLSRMTTQQKFDPQEAFGFRRRIPPALRDIAEQVDRDLPEGVETR